MPDTILLLRMEHANAAKLLNLMERQVETIAAGAAPDYGMLRMALTYFQSYPDKYHHPKEDLIYQRLSQRLRDGSLRMLDLIEEHEQLAGQTNHLARLVAEAQAGAAPAANQLCDGLRQFINDYRQHMTAEEEHIFPAALEQLSKDDWDQIDFSVFDQPDPLFDKGGEARFQQLQKQIKALDNAA